MPFICSEYQKRYSWQVVNETPVTDVILLGGVPYTAACALCGGMHEISAGSARSGIVTTPRCLIREYATQRRSLGQSVAWDTRYAEWLAKYPDAAQHQQIMVKMTSIAELLERPVVKLVAKKRKPAAPKVVPNGTTKAPAARTRKAKAA